MAVLVQGCDVVARRSAVDSKLEGGVASWFRRAPNSTACADPKLCRVGFMNERDAITFARDLEAAGLEGEKGGAYQDLVVLTPSGPWRHDCNWIEVGQYAGVTAAWLKATDPEPMVVPSCYRPTKPFVHLSEEEVAERLEFLRREGDVLVYLDKETGAEVYSSSHTQDPGLPDDVEERFQKVLGTIESLLTYNGIPKRLGWLRRRRLSKGIAELESMTAASGPTWRVWWFLGMARRSASDPEGAYDAFREAYRENPEHVGVVREYCGQCIALGLGKEAVALGRRSCALDPTDAGLRANLALALVVSGDMQGASDECAQARAADPDDPVTRGLEAMINDVVAGRRERPTRYP